MSIFDSLFAQELDRAARRQTRRRLRTAATARGGHVMFEGREALDFSSNDYLGLAGHPALAERVSDWTARHGAGARASRLVSGNLDLHEAVEAKLARFKGTEAALLFASGWQANAAVLPALLRVAGQGEPLVFCDRLNHASLHHGCQAAGVRQIRFRHNDLDHLDALLAERAGQPGVRLIATESVFSMDGDRADVAALCQVAERHGAFVYLDEAHATGVLGPRGAGLASLGGGRVDLAMGTFSKAMGSFGAYVAGSRQLCDYLVNTCSGFIYTTALPPPVLAAIDAALDLVPGMDDERRRLAGLGDGLRRALADQGLETGASSTQIVPAIVGEAGAALALSDGLRERGLLAVAIRPPTVPAGTSRLRIALSAAHGEEDVARLADAIAGLRGQAAGEARGRA
ncbi:8-amino-7-oxononanoate synthase [Pigmentiphaga sp.]|uniref:8-amino-7-oxononanoate synthase n=1 Tax=Pigmentiphaga sp. TaxID=1977564 RepID=UPI00128C055C|nr:8-amino-7-oxononanoate synthase [Pigmentiphaga sp.]MPS26322.1 8-amino-7-oxononanoate synthase [Alcaligenaceae bacterium SAGV5]MPS53421.1 8-amino-7-oxononanoate synthase [Alcaligenaceae bacterium SAGV3]MPT56371.1 8-amino-7-oxononanoate synthase [Alcaligenaceae bacterium]